MRRRRAGSPAVAVLTLAAVAVITTIAACRGGATAEQGAPGDSYRYVPPPPVRSYPSSYATIQGWINAGNVTAIRAHGWDIWQSITSATPYNRPAWETWFSGHELFEATGESHVLARAKHGVVRFGVRRNAMHPSMVTLSRTGPIPFDPAERVFAFNRFTATTALFIWTHGLNNGTTLNDTNNALTAAHVPLASRGILTSSDSTDSTSFVLKPVFQFIPGDQASAVPYWSGDSAAATTDTANPIASTWRQAVAVDPTGRLQPGDSVFLPVNNDGPFWLKVVPLSDFYHIKVTKEDSINFTFFGAVNGDLIGVANDTSLQAVLNAVRPGNIGLLVAMHVTGKEIPNWTWQSFWWGENPQDSQFGADRPKSIPAPWNHYNMTVAYYMMTTSGGPNVAYNPYLETSLAGKIPNEANPQGDSISWVGPQTNCMSCHRRAAIAYVNGQPVPQLYGPDMQVNPGDSTIFTQPYPGVNGRVPLLMTDFLWSVAIRATLPANAASGRAPKKP